MISMGARQTVGLFVHPIVSDTGLGIARVSMALAIGQLAWGALQPLFGAWADKGAPRAVLLTGALCLAAGQLLTITADSLPLLILTQGLLSPAGAAAASFSVLTGIVSARLAPETRSVASGIINAGGSLGQFLFAPAIQLAMHLRGHYAGLILSASTAILLVPLTFKLCRERKKAPAPKRPDTPPAPPEAGIGLRAQIADAFRNRDYILLHSGFFTCGFHVAFLTTHLPGEIALHGQPDAVSATAIAVIGLSNIAGSIGAGFAGKRFRMKNILACMYASRAALIAAYLAAPKTELNLYIFAAATGLTWLATVPPTAGLVGKLFGVRYLATLFGLTLFTHQLGAFLGAWLGGVAMEQAGNLLWVWYADMGLALFAALVNLPIREKLKMS
jgi:MFS family permease